MSILGELNSEAVSKIAAHLRKVADDIESGAELVDKVSSYGDRWGTTLTVQLVPGRTPLKVKK